MAKVGITLGAARIPDATIAHGWIVTTAFIVIAPMVGLVLGFGLMILVYWICRKSTPKKMDVWFRHLQLVSSGLLSYSHGANDAQKTMGLSRGSCSPRDFQRHST